MTRRCMEKAGQVPLPGNLPTTGNAMGNRFASPLHDRLLEAVERTRREHRRNDGSEFCAFDVMHVERTGRNGPERPSA
eukprot:scaffold499_cov335-Pavlova_lutheri.AAC.49